jgi:hypothetical protein
MSIDTTSALDRSASDYSRGGGSRGGTRTDCTRRFTEVGADCPPGPFADFAALVRSYDAARSSAGRPIAGAAAIVAAARARGFRAGVHPERVLRKQLDAIRAGPAAMVAAARAAADPEHIIREQLAAIRAGPAAIVAAARAAAHPEQMTPPETD